MAACSQIGLKSKPALRTGVKRYLGNALVQNNLTCSRGDEVNPRSQQPLICRSRRYHARGFIILTMRERVPDSPNRVSKLEETTLTEVSFGLVGSDKGGHRKATFKFGFFAEG